MGQELTPYWHCWEYKGQYWLYKGQYWLTNVRMVRYQGMLCENPHVHIEVIRTLNPATLLPIGTGQPDHNCTEVIDKIFSSRPDLADQPLKDYDVEYFTDESSFIEDRIYLAG